MAQKAHLLIVDDEANTLASLSRAFRLEGHEATVCDNANKALDLAKSQSFDLILSDAVSYTHLDVYKRQVVPYSLFLDLFAPAIATGFVRHHSPPNQL